MFSLMQKRRALLGIDISSTAVKLLELSQNVHKPDELYRIEAFALEPVPPNAVVEKKIVDPEAVGQSIQRAVARSGTKAKRAAVAVAGSAVITKTITMSSTLTEAEMEAHIELEADQYIPHPLEEVNVDFDILGPSSNQPEMIEVLLAASRRENIDDRVAALEVAGLIAEVVDVEAYAMENACSLLLDLIIEKPGGQILAIVDLGATTTTLHALQGGNIIYTREQNFGSNQLLEEIQRRYGLAREEARQQLLQGQLPDDFVDRLLYPYQENLTQQISRALQFFYSATSFNHTDQLILAGGSASIAGIAELAQDRLELPVAIAAPFAHMALAERIDPVELQQAAPSMMIAAGLAMRGFN